MRIHLTVFLLLISGSIHPIIAWDLEGSGYDLEGSGSGGWSEQGETKHTKDHPNTKDVTVFPANTGGENKNTFHGSSVLNFDSTHGDNGSGFIVMANSKSLLESKEIIAGVIAGGVTGAVLAATLAALLIYTWQKKDNGGYTLGHQKASD
ncbi:syndecan-4-like [Plectropomus leopardus]|uniref:syndecan-4-like n=1 Tax=Plectropomus leopardus TaxID=160734 RepID=UPI001C4DCABA|nr:syndecan-4-like [Plectropomus leopardus]